MRRCAAAAAAAAGAFVVGCTLCSTCACTHGRHQGWHRIHRSRFLGGGLGWRRLVLDRVVGRLYDLEEVLCELVLIRSVECKLAVFLLDLLARCQRADTKRTPRISRQLFDVQLCPRLRALRLGRVRGLKRRLHFLQDGDAGVRLSFSRSASPLRTITVADKDVIVPR